MDYAERVKPFYDIIRPDVSINHCIQDHTNILRSVQADMIASKHLHTPVNTTNLVIRVVAGPTGYTYIICNEGYTVQIAYKSCLYTNAEMHFVRTEEILTAVQTAVVRKSTGSG